jgi:hypothetical protein
VCGVRSGSQGISICHGLQCAPIIQMGCLASDDLGFTCRTVSRFSEAPNCSESMPRMTRTMVSSPRAHIVTLIPDSILAA